MRFVIRDPKTFSSGSRRFSAHIFEKKIKYVLYYNKLVTLLPPNS